MIQKLISIVFLFILFESAAQSNFKYEAGITFGCDAMLPKSIVGTYEYFSSSYKSGYGYSLGISNKLNYKKLFLRIQGSVGYATQSQDFVFSNDVDNIIDHSVKHRIAHWILDYSLGRDFHLNELNKLHVEVGFSTIGNFSYDDSRYDVTGSFSSTFVTHDNHWGDAFSTAEYDYRISYRFPILFSPFIKCGISIPVAKNRLVFGLTARLNRLVYRNFIVLSGENYTAIAASKSQSSSFGFYLNYEFSK